jgi:glycosyltransferase involved in cell wall biosynthesis
MKYVLIGDGFSPHLLKWAKELSNHVDLWVVSSRGFMPEFDVFLPIDRRFSFNAQPGILGWMKVFTNLMALGKWLATVDADWLNPHYLTSHGLLAGLVRRLFRLRARFVGSAWGSDVLLAPQRGWLQKQLLRWIFCECALTTSDSTFMAQKMNTLGARDVMVFPFGLEAMPHESTKDDFLFFSNRGLEHVYNPFRMLEIFERVSRDWPNARLVVANSGSLLSQMQSWANERELSDRIVFVGRLDSDTQANFYMQARWFISVPISDAVSVSVLEAMAHGCLPIVSDLPANHELIKDRINGRILSDGQLEIMDFLQQEQQKLIQMSSRNREWVKTHALFSPAMEKFLARLNEFTNT